MHLSNGAFPRVPLLTCLLSGLLSGCAVLGARQHTARADWHSRSFAAGRVTMDLPGKANDPPFRELVYSRLLCKRWIALTVGFFPVSTVEVWEYSGPEPMLRVDGLPPVPALPDFPRTEGVVETRRDAGSDPADGVFRTAVVWLPNAAGVVAVRVKTCPDTVGTEADILRVPVDDAVFKRIVESIRLDGRVPPTVDLGRLPDRVRTLPALPEQGNR